jgi:hypothetical protein
MQTVVDKARIPLNDADKDRYSDADLLGFVNAGIALAYKVRPDLAFGSYGTEFSELALGVTFPLPYQFQQAIADYAAFRAETKDDEAVNGGRAVLMLQLFEKELTVL